MGRASQEKKDEIRNKRIPVANRKIDIVFLILFALSSLPQKEQGCWNLPMSGAEE